MRRADRQLTAAVLAWVLLASASVGCGARTGPEIPDAGPDAPTVDAGPPVRCIEVPPSLSPVTATFALPVSLAVADVLFLIDSTASMEDEIDNVRSRLTSRVVPGVRAAIPDAAFGVALVGEFPEMPHGPPGIRPYELRAPITVDVVRVQGALDHTPTWGNFDDPEAQVEALYQVATGEGLEPWIPPSVGCPGGGVGGACFRRDSLPVVLLITDAPFHNGPPGIDPVADYELDPAPHTYAQMLEANRELGIFVVGLGARDVGRPSPMAHLRAVARDTGAVTDTGSPLAFDIGSRGDGVGDGIVDAIERLAEGLPLDVDAIVEDVPGDPWDATRIVTAVTPLRAEPASGARSIEGTRFLGVDPGTRVVFEVRIDPASLGPSESTRRIPARIIFRAFGRSRLGRVEVVIVVPGLDGGGCDSMEDG